MPAISKQVEDISEIFIELYLKALEESEGNKKTATSLKKAFKDFKGKSFLEKKNFLEDERIIIKDDQTDNLEEFIKFLDHYAKINDILRRLRGIANQQYFDQNFHDVVADAPKYVLETFAKQGVSNEDVQRFINQILISTATTSHPTNPNSTRYTQKAMALSEKLLHYSSEKHIDFKAALAEVLAEPIAGERKDQATEVEEGLLYLDSIYKAIPSVLSDLRKAISASKYQSLQLPKQLFDFNVWITGDGDGNPNSTAETLAHNIARFREAIKEQYVKDLSMIENLGLNIYGLKDAVRNPQMTLENFKLLLKNFYIEAKHEGGTEEQLTAVEGLIEKVEVFGFHYAKIEIRHESSDIMKALAAILREAGENIDEDFEKPEFEKIISRCLQDQKILEKLRDLNYEEINFGKNDELVKRLIGRFKLAAQNPDMFDKVIIAECQGTKNIHATLLLLAAAGNKVCEKEARLNIIPLAEEFKTLRSLPQDIASSFDDEEYFKHIKATKKIFFMIAKSDTVRRGGVGAQEAQETAVRESIKAIIEKLIEKGVKDLSDYEIIPYNGGGHALQRGGGRITELPSVYGRYALRALQELEEKYQGSAEMLEKIRQVKISAPEFTVQGHQNAVLFSPLNVGEGTLEALFSQALYASARLEGQIIDHEVEVNGDNLSEEQKIEFRKKAARDKDFICEKARDVYEQLHDDNSAINKLFENACWLSTKENNMSSRASVRGKVEEAAKQKTIGEVKGKKNILLKQRAIGAEKICAHSGTNFISWFTWADGLQAAKDKGVVLHDVYRGSKSFRDYMRSAAISLYMTDFSTSWQMMIGKEKPSDEQIANLAQAYKDKVQNNQPVANEETLAFIESEAKRTEELVFEAIYGRAKQAGEDLLSEKWPEIKAEIDYSNENSTFARTAEIMVTQHVNEFPQEIYDDLTKAVVRNAYCGIDSRNTPLGVMLALTKERSKSPTKDNQTEIPLLTSLKELTNVTAYAQGEQLAKRQRTATVET